MLTDIVAKGGNLLLNVGPRGVDAQIPDEQIARLDWLGEWVRPHADAIMATRPWVTPGTTTREGHPVRYTARDDTVYAFVRDAGGRSRCPTSAPHPRPRSRPSTERRCLEGLTGRHRDRHGRR